MTKQLSQKRLSKYRALESTQAVKDPLRCYMSIKSLLCCCWTQSTRSLDLMSCSEARLYPHEVVKTALEHNAAAMIITHNHPSGNPDISQADIQLTTCLMETLALVDVRVSDHIIVGTDGTYSLIENGKV